jgi:DNA-binding response OmpR family regulator
VAAIRILLTDDDKTIQDLYAKALPDDAFEKRFAGNGQEALEIYEEWHPEVIVLDIVMPLKTGVTVLEEIRNTFYDKATKIIMATSVSDTHAVRECLNFGIQGYIVKPFKLQEIAGKILQYIKPA